ncbi:MOSC domain-containing protein [Nocardioides sp. SYSU DS0663]|uniref:MOSC domain-containing protein n=1 Tax=Nocardioides sp. SYSU DS0663 TaxID=3416445 RepID=UPI003F4BA704
MVRAGFAPVKGTRHQAYDAVTLDRLGPVGDRAWCVVDTDARRVLRTVQHPSLVAVTASVSASGLALTLPTGDAVVGPSEPAGSTLTCDYWGRSVALELLAGPHADLLSAHLGKPVRLAAAPRGGIVYAGAVTLVSTGTLRALADALGGRAGTPGGRAGTPGGRAGTPGGRAGTPGGRACRDHLDALAARFRPTFVVDADEPHAEDGWIGQEVSLGSARVRVTSRVPRCAVVDVDPVTGARDGRVLAALAAYRPRDPATGDLVLGVDAEVVAPGVVSAG